jgi:hypothetical protein
MSQKQSLHEFHSGPRQAMHAGLNGLGMHAVAQPMTAAPHFKISQLCEAPFVSLDKPRPTGLAWIGDFIAFILQVG